MSENNSIDVVLLMRPPVEWWPCGVVGYPGDMNGIIASQSGEKPDSSLVTDEFNALVALLAQNHIPHVITSFPAELDFRNQPPQGAYDAVFLRDCVIIDPIGTAYAPARFRDDRRQTETQHITQVLDILGLKRLCEINDIPGYIEGGDTIDGVLPSGEKYLFTGKQRNDERGSNFLCELFGVSKHNHAEIETELCHIDSLMCAVGRLSEQGQVLQSLVLCPDLIDSGLSELMKISKSNSLQTPLFVSQKDTSAQGGNLAINGISFGSSLGDFVITGAQFNDQKMISNKFNNAGFTHLFSPLTQYLKFSSGGVRCSTQIIRVSVDLLKNLQNNLPCTGIEQIWLPSASVKKESHKKSDRI